MSAILTKPLIVPAYKTGLVDLYVPNTPDPSGASFNPMTVGTPVQIMKYHVDLTAVLNTILPGQGRTGAPNCCKMLGADLYIANSSANSQAILKLPNYLADPTLAAANAFVFTLYGSGYVGITFDAAGNLYTAEGPYGNNQIVQYTGTGVSAPGPNGAGGDNYASRAVIGNAGTTSFFGDLVFDAVGNLWVADYLNNRVVVFDAANLGTTNTWHALTNPGVPLAVANTVPGLDDATPNLFTGPEGLDFDSFAADANLWVGNNNDGNTIAQNAFPSLVKITPALQSLVLATPANSVLDGGSIMPNENCFIYQVPDYNGTIPQFGGLQIDKSTGWLYVNDEIGGCVRAYEMSTLATTPANPADTTSQLATIAVTNPGNGGIALLELGPYIADYSADPGLEPDDGDPNPLWDSTSIAVTQTDLGPQHTLPANVDVAGGSACYIYVQVNNFAPTTTTGFETLDLRWANASLGLAWPSPFDGGASDSGTGAPMGGTVTGGPFPIPRIPPFGSVIVGPVSWNAPNPQNYTDDAGNGHFCLLARIVTPNTNFSEVPHFAGMTYPEDSHLNPNVQNNARIAWRNIHIDNGPTGHMRRRNGVIAANYGPVAITIRIGFQLLDGGGRPMRAPPGRVVISAKGKGLTILERSALARLPRPDAARPEEGRIVLPDMTRGIDGLTLMPGEFAAFTADYQGPPWLPAYALRVSQYAKDAGGERLVGGQTFVHGHVDGFGIACRHHPE